jgi:hypothetical protein
VDESAQKEEFVLDPIIDSTAGELMDDSTHKEEFEVDHTIDSTAVEFMDESAQKELFEVSQGLSSKVEHRGPTQTSLSVKTPDTAREVEALVAELAFVL